MKKNDIISADVVAVTSEGAGICKIDGFALFVKGATVGDKIEAVVIKVNKNYAVGKLIKILSPSKDRIENDCPAFPRCGGCCYRHISYTAEKEIKKNKVEQTLQRIGGIDAEVEQIITGENEGYRNKAQYPIGEEIGFYAEHSHRIIEAKSCKLQPKLFADIVEVFDNFRKKYSLSHFDGERGVLRHLYIREGKVTGDIMVCVVINEDTLPFADKLKENLTALLGDRLKSLCLNINKNRNNVILSDRFVHLVGDGYIFDVLCGVKVRLSPLSFYQVNHDMAEKLYSKAKQYAGEGEVLFDLYCGAGTIGLSMADKFNKVVGVEIIEQAIKDAKFNAKLNGINNAEFYCGDAGKIAKDMQNCDTIIVDPPRKGLSADLPYTIAEVIKPKKIVYVSCDVATLARDLKALSQFGYKVQKVTAVDLFARTSHVESVCLLTKE